MWYRCSELIMTSGHRDALPKSDRSVNTVASMACAGSFSVAITELNDVKQMSRFPNAWHLHDVRGGAWEYREVCDGHDCVKEGGARPRTNIGLVDRGCALSVRALRAESTNVSILA